MRTWKLPAALAVAAGAGALTGAVRARRRRRPGPDRWHRVTIDCAPERLGPRPPPLDELGFTVEVRVRPAPGDHGTELAVRIAPDAGPRQRRDLRNALRAVRSRAEAGPPPVYAARLS
ncbi:hypothetical protein [Dactylosporangium sp. NPDC049140]|uniref:hypothetical protein n=1 Tax=Dactylosporangium sp. NPDC049140 TaxID=3155647 RepID=UPI0034112E96